MYVLNYSGNYMFNLMITYHLIKMSWGTLNVMMVLKLIFPNVNIKCLKKKIINASHSGEK